MTTIILTIIGIVLAAASALMMVYDGGNALNAGSVQAQADTLENAAANVIHAEELFHAETGGGATDLRTLIDGGYLGQVPTVGAAGPVGIGSIDPLDDGGVAGAYTAFLVEDVPGDVCRLVNRRRVGGDGTPTSQLTTKIGCYRAARGDTDVFYALLRPAA